MSGQRRAPTWCGRLLMCAALLLGIVTMHTLGHPAEHGSSHMPGSTVAAASAPVDHAMEPSATEGPRANDQAPLGRMDPMSVCLAVLTVWTIVLLAAGALSYRPADLMTSARARRWHALRPNPPPGSRRTRLAQLSALRI
ncbi:DUF6153 family protein [Streptomyces lavendulocolor]|uniref:DUF6153 family protein n=1 Tax=Streptomyces lavendulocolor TaxID=67316 RepID=UPI0033FF2141